jgi:hypothetical protein
MEKTSLRLKPSEAISLEKKLQKHGLQYSYTKKKDRFLPSPWVEILIPTTPILIKILYDLIKERKRKTQILVKMDDVYVELNAENVRELDFQLKKSSRQRKKNS